MEEQQHLDLLQANKSLDMKDQSHPSLSTVDLTTAGALKNNEPLSAVLSQAGSAYTAQNDIKLTSVSRRMNTADLGEIDWSYVESLKKPYVVYAGQWLTTAASGSNLLVMEMPKDYFLANHVLRNIGSTFLSFRGDFHCVVSVQGMPQASGMIIASAYYGNPDFLNQGNPTNALFRPNIILDASDNSSTGELVVPFRYYRNSCDPFETDLFKLRLDVLSVLASSTPLSYTISIYLDNIKLRFLRPKEPTALRATQGLINVTNITNNMNDVIESTIPANITGDRLDVDAKMMDAVPLGTNPNAVVVKFNSMNNADNPFYVEKVALTTAQQQPVSLDTFNTELDEMSLKTLLIDRETRTVNDIVIPATGTLGGLIREIYVAPGLPIATSLGPQQGGAFQFIPMFCRLWRGGIRVKLRFVMSRFHSMKIYVAMFYKTTVPTTITDWSTSHGVIVDIGGDQREIDIEIPYNAETPWLQVPNIPIPWTDTLNNSKYSQPWDFILGKLAIYRVSNLVYPTGLTPQITMIQTLRGAEDFELANYATTTLRRAQGRTIMLAGTSERTEGDTQDVVHSLKQLCKRYVLRSQRSTENDFNKYRVCAQAMFPGDMNGEIYDDIIADDSVRLVGPHYATYAPSLFYSGYRGGWTVRIETTVGRSGTADAPAGFNPFCLFINPPEISQVTPFNYAQFLDTLTNALHKYFSGSNDETQEIVTPYIIQPINSTSGIVRTAVFEVDIPQQHNLKYTPLWCKDRMRLSHGILLYGWVYNNALPDIDPPPVYEVLSRVYQKMSDDGRFGIINNNYLQISSDLSNDNHWGLPYYTFSTTTAEEQLERQLATVELTDTTNNDVP